MTYCLWFSPLLRDKLTEQWHFAETNMHSSKYFYTELSCVAAKIWYLSIKDGISLLIWKILNNFGGAKLFWVHNVASALKRRIPTEIEFNNNVLVLFGLQIVMICLWFNTFCEISTFSDLPLFADTSVSTTLSDVPSGFCLLWWQVIPFICPGLCSPVC